MSSNRLGLVLVALLTFHLGLALGVYTATAPKMTFTQACVKALNTILPPATPRLEWQQ